MKNRIGEVLPVRFFIGKSRMRYLLPVGFRGGIRKRQPEQRRQILVISRIRVRLTAVPFQADRTV
jgi:hypothetical protein